MEPIQAEIKSAADNVSRKNYGSVRTRHFASEIGSFYSPMGSIMLGESIVVLAEIRRVFLGIMWALGA